MALAAFSTSASIKVADAASNTEFAKLAAIAGNGADVVGFTHLADRGLDERFWVPTTGCSAVSDKKNGVTKHRTEYVPLRPEDVACAFLDYGRVEGYLRLRGVAVDKIQSYAALATAMRCFAGRHGMCHGESIHVKTHLGKVTAEGLHLRKKADAVPDDWLSLVQEMPKGVEVPDGSILTPEAKDLIFKALSLGDSILGMLIALSGFNYFHSNHTSVGTRLPRGQLKVMCTLLGVSPPSAGPTMEKFVEDITTCFYVGAHPANKISMMRYLYPSENPDYMPAFAPGSGPVVEHIPWESMDDFMKIRKPTFPAGLSSLAIVQSSMREMAETAVLLFCPDAGIHVTLKNDLQLVKNCPLAYHPGAKYLGVQEKKLAVDVYKNFLPEAAYLFHTTGRMRTILASPLMQAAMQIGPSVAVRAAVDLLHKAPDTSDVKKVMEDLKKAGVSVKSAIQLDDNEAVQEALDGAIAASNISLIF